jgi:CBS domain-containing protein
MLDRLLQFVTGSPAFQFLRSVAPLDLLPDDELGRLADAAGIDYHARGSVLLVRGQSAVTDVLVVTQGALEVSEDGPRAGAPRRLGAGEIHGGACLLANDGIARATVRAAEDTFLYALPAAAFLEACARHRELRDFFTGGLGGGRLERVGASLRRKWLVAGSEPGVAAFGRSVGELCDRDVAWCAADEPVREVARRMTAERRHTLLVRDAAGALAGIVTDRDLLANALARGLDPASPVAAVAGPAHDAAPADARVADAVERMVRAGTRALPVAGADGEVVGLLADEDLLLAHGSSPVDYLREIAGTRLRRDLAEHRARLPRLVRALMLDGARVDTVTWLVSAATDATLRRLLDLAVAELGPPPAPFAFLSLGSQGRREQTLVTDQDNALLYADAPGAEREAEEYFARLGEVACTWLAEAGVAYCDGEVMASNAKWCRPLSAWKRYFADWVSVPEPLAVMHSSIFFDFREIYGDAGLAASLRDHIGALLATRPGMFFHLLAQAVVEKELPLGLSGRIALETHGDREQVVDVKQPVARICELARLHALWSGVREVGTLERLRELGRRQAVDAEVCLDLEHAYSFLMQLRLARQVAAVGAGGHPADNLVGVEEISTLERRFLEDSFALVRRVQAGARRKFLREL